MYQLQLVQEEEILFTAAGEHVRHAQAMCKYCREKSRIPCESKVKNVTWKEWDITEVANYAQNGGLPYFVGK